VLLREARGQHAELGAGIGQRGAGRETRDDVEPPLGSGHELGRVEGERVPEGDRGVVGEAELRRHHADDLVRHSVERKRPPDRLRIATQPAEPEPMAQHHDAIAPRRLLLREEGAPQRRRDAERPEQIGRGPHRSELLRLAVAGESEAPGGPCRHLVEGARLAPPVEEVGRRCPLAFLARGGLALPQHHQPVGGRI